MALREDKLREYLEALSLPEFYKVWNHYLSDKYPQGNDLREKLADDNLIKIRDTGYTVFVPTEDEKYFRAKQRKTPTGIKKIVIISNDNQILDQTSREELKEAKLAYDLLSMRTLAAYLKSLSNADQRRILGEDSPYVLYNFPKIETLEEIEKDFSKTYSALNKMAKAMPASEKSEFHKGKEVGIKEKFKHNLSGCQETFSTIYKTSFKHYYAFEKLVKSMSTHMRNDNYVDNWETIAVTEISDITGKVSQHYPINGTVLIKLAKVIQKKFGEQLDSILCAHAIVIYFFERCAIGARNKEDKRMARNNAIEQIEIFGRDL